MTEKLIFDNFGGFVFLTHSPAITRLAKPGKSFIDSSYFSRKISVRVIYLFIKPIRFFYCRLLATNECRSIFRVLAPAPRAPDFPLQMDASPISTQLSL